MNIKSRHNKICEMPQKQRLSGNLYKKVCIKKYESSQINDLSYHLKQIENEEQTKPKANRRKS